jgi:hypothetical protein
MKPETTKQLEALLDQREQKKQAANTRAAEQRTAEDKNLADFVAKKNDVIVVAFQEIVDLYKRRGIQLLIEEENEKQSSSGGVTAPSIRLDMKGAYSSSSDMKPEFRLYFDKKSRKVSLHTATPSQSSPAGQIALDALTTDWIQSEFLKYQFPPY